MTLRDDRDASYRDDDRVVVSPGVPTDRVRWGPILAGTFAALTALAVLSTLGTAIGLSAYDPGQDDPRNFARAGGIWGVLCVIIAFAFGGWLTARAAAVKGRSNGMLNGFMVAGFGIPLMLFMLGSIATAMGAAAATAATGHDAEQARIGQSDNAMTASASIGSDNRTAQPNSPGNVKNVDSEDARKAASRAAWGSLFGLVLAIAAASFAGAAGAREDRDSDNDRDRRYRDSASTPTPAT
ncbi:MAG: hypothetical protein QOF78_674 [Phycisphaerales bacterium]|jgi:hypothetical protein|nr:hypothetical protein [Phycisphaerales bacterium]